MLNQSSIWYMTLVNEWKIKGLKSGLSALYQNFLQTSSRTFQNVMKIEQFQEGAIWYSRAFSFYLQRNITGTACSHTGMGTKPLHNIFSAKQPVPHLSASRRERKQIKNGKEKRPEFGHRKETSAKGTKKR